ncbi:uncharacterized protein LOC115363529 isoform X2 [Myripristis murdjan]|uniref:uncharacterized protein LOC115363529 isoform X2 n=1 Tax=Myripristis murdjan TaxID=586833 RepID=UPI0011763A09|nr:uncharacterized protein LOC115363529 isoform X2 [Myripristis murdjan]
MEAEQLLSSHSSEETEDSEDERRPASGGELRSPWRPQSSAAALTQTVMIREKRHHDAARQLQVCLMKSRERTAYFTAEEQRIILEKYEEEKLNIHLKSNTAAAAKSRQNAWQRIADCINACNPSGVKRTWEQVKVKHKNIIAFANRKRNLQRQAGRGGPGEKCSPAEELALTNNEARPIKDGVEAGVASNPGSQSTHVTTYGDIMEVVVPGVPPTSDTMSQAEAVDIRDEMLSTSSDRAVEEENHRSPGEPRASTRTGRQSRSSTCWGGRGTQLKRSQKSAADPVRALYKRSLEKDLKYKDLKMQKMELEIEYLKLKIAKLTEKEENHYK